MIDINVINLVTKNLIQSKEEVEYKLNSLTHIEDRTPNKLEVIKTTLREYNNLMADIQLWESIINGIEEQNTKNTQKESV